MGFDPLEVGYDVGEIQQAKREASALDELAKVDAELSRFWERLEVEIGTPVNVAAMEVPAPFATRINYSPPDEFVDDELQPLKDFIKGAKAELRGPITNGQIRRKLGVLGEIVTKVANRL